LKKIIFKKGIHHSVLIVLRNEWIKFNRSKILIRYKGMKISKKLNKLHLQDKEANFMVEVLIQIIFHKWVITFIKVKFKIKF